MNPSKTNKPSALPAKSGNPALVIYVCLIIAGIIGFFSWLQHVSLEQRIIAQAQEQSLAVAKATANGVEEFLKDVLRELRFGARLPAIQAAVQVKSPRGFSAEDNYYTLSYLYKNLDSRINTFYLLDSRGILICSEPYLETSGGSYLDIPGVSTVMREQRPHITGMFQTRDGENAYAVLQPVFAQDDFVGIVLTIIKFKDLHRDFIQSVETAKGSFFVLLDNNGTILYHPDHALIGGNMVALHKEREAAGEKHHQEKTIKAILGGSVGFGEIPNDKLLGASALLSWTYISTNSTASGTAGIKLSYDKDIKKDLLKNKAVIIARELDKRIPTIGQLTSSEKLRDLINSLREKYPDIIELTIHGPRSADDSTLIYKASTSPGLAGKLSDPEDVLAVQEDKLSIQFTKQKAGRPYAGTDVIDVTVPIHTGIGFWPLAIVQSRSAMTETIHSNARPSIGLTVFVIFVFSLGGFFLYRAQKKKAVLLAQSKNLQIIADKTKAQEGQDRLMANLFESISHPFYVMDANDYTVQMANSAAGFSDLSQASLCYLPSRRANEPCGEGNSFCLLDEVKKAKKATTVEHVFRDQDGVERFLELHGYPIFDDEGNVSQMIGYSFDITDRKRAEEEKSKLEDELFQAQKMEAIGNLAGGIAHDFNNILSLIVGYSEMVKDDIQTGSGDSQVEDDINQVINAGVRATELVQQILTFSRKTELVRQSLRMHLIVKEALKMVRSSLPSSIEIRQNIDPECGPVLADPTKIHQIVLNLCTNALHAMADGKGTLSISLGRKEIGAEEISERGVAPGPFVVLSISDTGHGMDKEIVARIFEPYFTTKETGKGTGLGLAVIHGIISEYEGFIRVESEVGKGTSFHVHIPLLETDITTPEETTPEELLPMGNERIMVVDDESDVVIMNKTILNSLGYEVTALTDSEEALEKIRMQPHQFDLLITDQTMPGLTGAELAREVLKIRPDLPIILCTGFSAVLSEEAALAIGIKKYIEKPIRKKQFAQITRMVLDDQTMLN